MTESTDTIERLEKSFWQALVDKDVDAAKAMIADDALVVNPSGTMRIDPEKYAAMLKDGQWSLDSFEFSEVEVAFPSDDTAVIVYKAHQKGDMSGEAMDLHCADSSTWVRDGNEWKCALHTETILGDMPLTN